MNSKREMERAGWDFKPHHSFPHLSWPSASALSSKEGEKHPGKVWLRQACKLRGRKFLRFLALEDRAAIIPVKTLIGIALIRIQHQSYNTPQVVIIPEKTSIRLALIRIQHWSYNTHQGNLIFSITLYLHCTRNRKDRRGRKGVREGELETMDNGIPG